MTDNTVYDNQRDPLGEKRLAQARKKDWLKLELRILDGRHAEDLKAKIRNLRTEYTQMSDELYRKVTDIDNAFQAAVDAIQRDVGISQQMIAQVH
jgi:hypothetical protein